jgi:hypothetical protein
MGTLGWTDVDKARDVVALARARDEELSKELLDPYLRAAVRAAMDLFRYADDYEEAIHMDTEPPDHQERFKRLGLSLNEFVAMISAASALTNALAYRLGLALDMSSDEILETYANWLATFNPSEFPLDPGDVEFP